MGKTWKSTLTQKEKKLWLEDFEELPVSFEQFIGDTNYLGNAWLDANGETETIYPYWKETGKKLFPLPCRSPYDTLILAGATGLGKTTFAVSAVMAYYLHVVMCLRNPHEYFNLANQKPLTFAVLNIVTKTMAYKNAWGILHKALIASPWFRERGRVSTGNKPEWSCINKPIDLLYGRCADDVIGLDLICCMMDEVNFARIRNVQAAQERATEVFDAALERMKSRFTKFGGLYEGLMIMASSKRTDQAFLEVFTRKLMKGVAGKRVYLVDEPRWVVLPEGTYGGETFPVAVGDKFLPSQIIKPEEAPTFIEAGYRILHPPIETKAEFERNINKALTNIAGVSVESLSTWIRGDLVRKAINKKARNPFIQSVIYVGTKDTIQYKDYFDLQAVSKEAFARPLFIHIDASLGGDGYAISGSYVAYAKYQTDFETNDLVPELHYEQVFKIKIKAPKGDQVMLSKTFQFIMWLNQYFNLAKVTHDQYQSLQLGQDLRAKGIDASLQSIDRVINGINQPYLVLYNAFYEGRIKILDDDDQTMELVQLEKHENGVIDKPIGGFDDASQALCGSIYNASQAKEEFLRSNSILLANTVSAEEVDQSVLERDLANMLDSYLSEGLYYNKSIPKVNQESGLRATFDKYVSKNKQDDEVKPRSKFNFF